MSNKFFKILFAAEIVLMLIVAALSITGKKNQELPTAYAVKENLNENIDFKTFTKAVCEEKAEHVYCRDELFVKCNGKEFVVDDGADNFKCSNLTINLAGLNVKGDVIFRKDRN